MKNIFQKFLTNKKNRKLTIGNQNEFQGIISPVSPVAIVDEPITFSSDVDFTNANVIGIDTTPDTSGLWNLDGNSIQSGDFIGTTNAQPLVLKTNGTEVAVFPSSQFDTIKIGKSIGSGISGLIIANNSAINVNGEQNLIVGRNIANFEQNNTGYLHTTVVLGDGAGAQHTGYRNFTGGAVAGAAIYSNDSVHIGYNVSNFAGNPTVTPLNLWILGNGWTETSPGIFTHEAGSTNNLNLNYNLNITYPYIPIPKSFTIISNVTVTSGSIAIRDINTSQIIRTITTTGIYENNLNNIIDFIQLRFEPSSDFVGTVQGSFKTYGLRVVNRVVIIGSEAKPKDNLDTNEIVIGYNAVGNGSNTATLGNDSIANTYLKGNLQLPAYGDGNVTGTATKLLGVDTNGKVVETPYAGYKVYTARVMFNGVDGFPVPTILENTLGGSPAWSKDATGIYSIVLSNAFTTGKVFISHTQVSTTNTKQIIQEINSSTLQINNYDLTSTPALSDITTTTPMFVEIRVYP